jgi:alkanesulfonate monooxygenase SsuD/methylene tetrahydromethanopterin reductase-like flavin-dependent oxidoreductase (luciferase family)
MVRRELQKSGRNPADFAVAQLRMVYVAGSEDRAWDDIENHVFAMMEFYTEILAEANDAAGDKNVFPYKSARKLRRSPLAEAATIGTPEQVARKLNRFRNEFRCTHFIMATQLPGLEPAKATKSFGAVLQKE